MGEKITWQWRPLILLAFFWANQASSQNTITGDRKPSGIWAVAWSPDDRYIALGGDDSTLYLYNSRDYRSVRRWTANSMVKGMSWHPEGKILAIATMKGVQLLDVTSAQLTTIEQIKVGGRAIGWNHNGELLGFADGAGALQIMTKEEKLLRSIKKHNNHSYLTMDWHPAKNIIVAASDDIVLFDTSGKQLGFIKHRKEYTSVLTARWHPSGEFFATGDYGHEGEGIPTLLQFWKEDGTLLVEKKGSKAEYRNIRWNKEGTVLATASDQLRLWSRGGELVGAAGTGYDLWGVSWNPAGNLIVTTNFGTHVDLWTGEAKLVKRIE